MITTAIFPGRYVQGANAIELCLAEELKRLGSKALLLQSPSVNRQMGSTIEKALDGKINYEIEIFNRECSDEEIERLCTLAKVKRVDIIVGMGGGKAQDTAKAVGDRLNCKTAIVPSLASTDAPCSALAVVYTEDGQFKRYLVTKHNPDLVLVDSKVIAEAPARFLVAGMGDALATIFEAEDCHTKGAGNMTGRPGPLSAQSLAALCYDILLQYGVLAKNACERKVVTPALEHVIEANTLLSGLGFESGGLAAAHAIHNGLTVLPQTHDCWHGEKVTFGVLTMLMLSDRDPEIIDEVYTFCESVGLPTTLAEIGLANVTEAELMKVAEASCQSGETIHNEPFEVTPYSVYCALIAADQEGIRRKSIV